MQDHDLHDEFIATITLGHQECIYCGKVLDGWELAENMKPIPYCDTPVCFKCAVDRV